MLDQRDRGGRAPADRVREVPDVRVVEQLAVLELGRAASAAASASSSPPAPNPTSAPTKAPNSISLARGSRSRLLEGATLPLSSFVTNRRSISADDVVLAEALELREDLAGERSVAEADHEQLHRADDRAVRRMVGGRS